MLCVVMSSNPFALHVLLSLLAKFLDYKRRLT